MQPLFDNLWVGPHPFCLLVFFRSMCKSNYYWHLFLVHVNHKDFHSMSWKRNITNFKKDSDMVLFFVNPSVNGRFNHKNWVINIKDSKYTNVIPAPFKWYLLLLIKIRWNLSFIWDKRLPRHYILKVHNNFFWKLSLLICIPKLNKLVTLNKIH